MMTNEIRLIVSLILGVFIIELTVYLLGQYVMEKYSPKDDSSNNYKNK